MLVALVKAALLLAGGTLTIAFLVLAARVFVANKFEYNQNRKLSKNLGTALKGEIPSFHDGRRDYRVAAGLAIDSKNKCWAEQGKLSEEAISIALN